MKRLDSIILNSLIKKSRTICLLFKKIFSWKNRLW